MNFSFADRIQSLPPYLFAEIDRLKAEVVARGVEVISLGIGDPDLPTPQPIVDALKAHADNPENHQYPSYQGSQRFREAVARWYGNNFDVQIDPQSEVLAMIGSKEGIFHFPLAFCNPGDVVLYTEPGYPVYPVAAKFAGAEPVAVPLLAENDFLPDLDAIPEETCKRAKIFFLNYPNNPTSVDAPDSFFEALIAWGQRNEILIAHDAAYTEIYMGDKPKSILEFPGAKEVAVEFHSLSKTFHMTGWRIAMAVGNQQAVKGLGQVKTNVDSGAFGAVQDAAIFALDHDQEITPTLRDIYRKRRQVMVEALEAVGLKPTPSSSTFYIWTPTPNGVGSKEFCAQLLEQLGVVVTPGIGFGPSGEGYFRISLTAPEEDLLRAAERIKQLGEIAS